MFEWFTDSAKEAMRHSQEEARELRHAFIGTEHLLLGVIAANTEAASVLAERGLPLDIARDKVRQRLAGHERLTADEALATLGIDLSAVKQRAEAAFGEGVLATPEDHPPFTPKAKKSLENSLAAALELACTEIGPEHMLLGLLRDGGGVAYEIVDTEVEGGVTEVLREVEAQIAASAGDDRPALDPDVVVNGALAIMQIVQTAGRGPLPPGDWAAKLREEASHGAAVFVDARQGEDALTRWVDAAKGLAAGLGFRTFPLGSQTYVLHPPDKRVTPDVRREILRQFSIS